MHLVWRKEAVKYNFTLLVSKFSQMAVLNVLTYPDARLRQRAETVETVDADIRRLVDDMAETMYAAPGIGLAAVQVGVLKRVIVIDISDERNDLNVFVNPVITSKIGTRETEEGCLSVPGVYATVNRADAIVVRALDRNGAEFSLETDGVLSVCVQHEVDHLDGKVFVDYLSRIKQERIRKKFIKQSRRGPATPSAVAVM